MSDVAALRLVEVEDGAPEEALAEEPRVFAKSIAVPPGAPWDQDRSARLEARMGAPLAGGEVTHQLRRLEPWRPGKPGRFVALYARTKDVGAELRTEVIVEGRALEVVFQSRTTREQQSRRQLIVLTGAGVGMLVLALSVAIALSARSDADARLTNLETAANTKAHLGREVEMERREARALSAAAVKGRAVSDLLADLDWASGAKAPGARIQAIHWDHGTFAVEVRGDTTPFAAQDRLAVKVDKPLRPGVWLWGVTKPSLQIVPAEAPAEDSAGSAP